MNRRRLFAIARKELIQILRDARSLAIVLIMPVMLMALMGYGTSLDQKNIPTCAYDRENSQQSQDLLKHFQSSPYFDLKMVTANYRELVASIDSGECSLGLVIPHDFSELLRKGGPVGVQGLVDATNDNTANVIFGYAEAVIGGYSAQIQLDFLHRKGRKDALQPIAVEARTWFNEDLDSKNFIVPGVVAIVMAVIGAFLTSLTVAREWERGTMEQLISTPVTPLEITLGKLLPYFAIGMIDAVICATIAIYWFRVPFRGSVAMLLTSSALFLAVVMLMGYWISAAAKSQLAASQFALIATFLPSFLLSGFAFPLDQTPLGVQAVSYLIPARYYVKLMKSVFLKGVGVGPSLPQLFALVLMTVVVGRLALRSLHKSLE